MAKFPDGTILMYKPDHKSVSVDVTTEELIKCKNCMFSVIKDIPITRGIKSVDCIVCKVYSITTNPEGYCWRAVRKDDNDGRQNNVH